MIAMTNNKPNDVRVVSVELLERLCMRPRKDSLAVNHQDIVDRGQAQAELRAILAQPADQQGEPAAWANGEQLLLCSRSRLDVDHPNPIYHNTPRNVGGSALKTEYCDTPLYRHAQPATAKVVLPERLYADRYGEGWNACLDEVASLNNPQ